MLEFKKSESLEEKTDKWASRPEVTLVCKEIDEWTTKNEVREA